jgi:ribosomal protein L35
MKPTLKNRIKITKSGKILRRATTLGHSKANKRTVELKRKKHYRPFQIKVKKLNSAL